VTGWRVQCRGRTQCKDHLGAGDNGITRQGTPQPIVSKLSEGLDQALDDEAVRRRQDPGHPALYPPVKAGEHRLHKILTATAGQPTQTAAG
jgi:hypothetical protein